MTVNMRIKYHITIKLMHIISWVHQKMLLLLVSFFL